MPTPILGAPVWTEGQALPATRGNEIVAWLEFFAAGGNILDRGLNDPASLTPANGDAYLIGGSPVGAWAGQANKIALRINGGWVFITAQSGMRLWVADEEVDIRYNGTAWIEIGEAAGVPSRTESGTTIDPVLGDANGFIYCTSGSGVGIEIPNNSVEAFPVNTRISFFQMGAGQLTFTAAGGVTINYADIYVNKSHGQYSLVTAIKTATNDWLLTGTLELAP